MDEIEYKEVYNSVNAQRCVFEKASLTRMYQCENHVKINIGEREAAGCADENARQQCQALLQNLRRNAAFSLKLTSISGKSALPHAKELKVQCGGLNGLQLLTDNTAGMGISNIHGTVIQAINEFGSIDSLPYERIVQSISQFQGRRRS